MEKESILIKIKTIDNLIIRHFMTESKKKHLCVCSPYQIAILKYLIQHREDNIYQHDLEKEFNLRRSTVSGIIDTMEKNEMIERIDSAKDARTKQIKLTDKAITIAHQHQHTVSTFERLLQKDITKQELDTFYLVSDKIIKNLMEEK